MQITIDVLHRIGIREPTAQEINLVQAVLKHINADQEIHFNPRLSKREKECLHLLAQGKTFLEIATDMQIKRTTVATFIKRIKHKLNCATIPQAVFSGISRCDIWQKRA